MLTLAGLLEAMSEVAIQGRYELLVSQIEQALRQLYKAEKVWLLLFSEGACCTWPKNDEIVEADGISMPVAMLH